ncbi:MAG: methylmalonyl Co-A mutase-associated GTPase MeaB [Candidatus Eremiobacteraeota bacterium]|nr:methylmalonyl Co-A mutase-associated GTPase MeaB [Candidatus Eremiobacteraeota bacterium]
MDLDQLAEGVRAGQRGALARAITLAESRRPEHRSQARRLLELLPPGRSHRIGITGPPGAGKSTLIESLGLAWIQAGARVAVLAVDPTSQLSGGSILGDKTRMEQLSTNPGAYIRPSPNGKTLGGVTRSTRQAIELVEAAGYNLVIVETVGIGQADTLVSRLVDTVALVVIPGAGDELQGIKRGVMEIADLLVINKCEGDNQARAAQASAQYHAALRLLPGRTPDWKVPILRVSGLTHDGLDELRTRLDAHGRFLEENDSLARQRREQATFWLDYLLDESLREAVLGKSQSRARYEACRRAVSEGLKSPEAAIEELLSGLSFE